MPEMPQNDLELANAALVVCGCEPIASFADDSDEAVALNSFFETVVQGALTEKPWNFCGETAILTRSPVVPLDRWAAIYHLPVPKPIRIRTCRVGDQPIHYQLYNDGLYCNAQLTDTVVLDYTVRLAVHLWPAKFSNVVQLRLCARIAASLTSASGKVSEYAELAEIDMAKIANITSQGETVKRRPRGRMIAVRRGARY